MSDALAKSLGLPPPDPASPVQLTVALQANRFVLRGTAAVAALGGTIALPVAPRGVTHAGNLAALWLGPDEWLLLDEAADANAAALLAKSLDGAPCSLVDVSDRQLGIVVRGRCVADALAMFVPLDLDVRAFPVGTATRTVFEKAEIVLWRRAEHHFHVEVWRSFAPYVAGLLAQAQSELRAG